MFGTFAGPGAHILNIFALTDPLLAMTPALREIEPRVGHFVRYLPREYLDSVAERRSRFEDPDLTRLFEALQRVHSGPVWTVPRWLDIWKLNTGRYDHLIDEDLFRYPSAASAHPTQRRLRSSVEQNALYRNSEGSPKLAASRSGQPIALEGNLTLRELSDLDGRLESPCPYDAYPPSPVPRVHPTRSFLGLETMSRGRHVLVVRRANAEESNDGWATKIPIGRTAVFQ